jgi:hypothetical protein
MTRWEDDPELEREPSVDSRLVGVIAIVGSAAVLLAVCYLMGFCR